MVRLSPTRRRALLVIPPSPTVFSLFWVREKKPRAPKLSRPTSRYATRVNGPSPRARTPESACGLRTTIARRPPAAETRAPTPPPGTHPPDDLDDFFKGIQSAEEGSGGVHGAPDV